MLKRMNIIMQYSNISVTIVEKRNTSYTIFLLIIVRYENILQVL